MLAGQAQKEFFVNEALCLIDALHGRAIVASQPAPPATAPEGACFRITAPAAAEWAGHEGDIAVRIGGDWRFIDPADGLLVFDRAAGQLVMFRSQWRTAAPVAVPVGGTVVDTEARAAVTALVRALEATGVLPTPLP